jgi:hypothetical protein
MATYDVRLSLTSHSNEAPSGCGVICTDLQRLALEPRFCVPAFSAHLNEMMVIARVGLVTRMKK